MPSPDPAILARLRTIVGDAHVLTSPEDTLPYGFDGTAALKGPADRMLVELGHEPSVVGVASLYAPFCGALVIDRQDAHRAAEVEATGVRCVVTDTIMSTPAVAEALARTTLEAVR